MLPESQADRGIRNGCQRLIEPRWRARGDEVFAEVEARNTPKTLQSVGKKLTLLNKCSDVGRRAENCERSRVSIDRAIELRASSIDTGCEAMLSQVVNEGVGVLKDIVRSSLRKSKNIHTNRTVARNYHLPDRSGAGCVSGFVHAQRGLAVDA